MKRFGTGSLLGSARLRTFSGIGTARRAASPQKNVRGRHNEGRCRERIRREYPRSSRAGAIFVAWCVYGIAAYWSFGSWQDRGTFGDMFGALNALFAGLAFAGLIAAILLQRAELELQRLDLVETRKELSRAADAQAKSQEALDRQAKNTELAARLQSLSTLVAFYDKRIAEVEPLARVQHALPARQKELAAYETARYECLHWLHQRLREQGVTIPFPEQADR